MNLRPAPTKHSPMQLSHDVLLGDEVTAVITWLWQFMHTTCVDARPKAAMPPPSETTTTVPPPVARRCGTSERGDKKKGRRGALDAPPG